LKGQALYDGRGKKGNTEGEQSIGKKKGREGRKEALE
jgi:hypothetical protein